MGPATRYTLRRNTASIMKVFDTLSRFQCFLLLYFEEFLLVINKWGKLKPKLSNHIINEVGRVHSKVLTLRR